MIVLAHLRIVWSLPTGERGLKFESVVELADGFPIAPYRGAWIEILIKSTSSRVIVVAPYRGAWIEMVNLSFLFISHVVAPYRGAWIEISVAKSSQVDAMCRSLQGSVD